eukprot:CAMPEP_0172685854 /NCGR_PEP_ID=MMETSP1074-20121228/20531_1 /TAXON_ID=2916 /ORGANISM="Ceratium fusus, Strain PA161109" /LENGTH=1191 /DNA_ID=CAMNT_0013505075 /DNA_START=29 /DNA_END=3604 /DNA_ORIENTATION=+
MQRSCGCGNNPGCRLTHLRHSQERKCPRSTPEEDQTKNNDEVSAARWRYLSLALALFILVDKFGVVDFGWTASWTNFVHIGSLPSIGSDAADYWPVPLPPASHEPHRRLGAQTSDGGAGGASANTSEDEHAHHPNEVLYFLVGAIIAGVFVMHVATLDIFKGMQQTVVLFVFGLVTSLVMKGVGDVKDSLGAVGHSYDMWMHIDPHLLMWTLLPPLLAGDAMTIDTFVAQKVALQCMYLAGPGVAINSMIFAGFIFVYLPYGWDFYLCLTLGSILAATDPVAVVALLKELGASPTLTVQIQGESLLNDGIAIVLYHVAKDLLTGKQAYPDPVWLFSTVIRMALCAWILGCLIGGFFLMWIRAAKSKTNHSSNSIQVLLTIACAYSSFIVAEGVFGISGVLSTVAASLVLAHKGWPEIVNHETMHTIWHMLETIGNTIIFFLAGALTGKIFLAENAQGEKYIGPLEYMHLLVIYAVLVVLRTGLITASRPLLRLLVRDRQPVTLPDALVMSWGGLRGAVGLALAIQVSMDGKNPDIAKLKEEDGNRVLFYVGGVALLTLVINAVTCPLLVRFLEITKTPETKRKLMLRLYQQMADDFAEFGTSSMRVVSTALEDIKHDLELKEADHEMLHPDLYTSGRHSTRSRAARTKTRNLRVSLFGGLLVPDMQPPDAVINEFIRVKQKFEQLPLESRNRLLSLVPNNPWMDNVEEAFQLLRTGHPDPGMICAINHSLVALVRAQYWKQVEHFQVTSAEVDVLLKCATLSLIAKCHDVKDFNTIRDRLKLPEEEEEDLNRALDVGFRNSESEPRPYICNVANSPGFHIFIFLAILANAVFVVFEEYLVSDTQATTWLIVEAVFMVVFTVEFFFRFFAQGREYFQHCWNVFDLVVLLLGLGIFALNTVNVINGATPKSNPAQQARLLHILRAVRLVRLIKSWELARAVLTGDMASIHTTERIHRLCILLGFIRAHVAAQEQLIRFLGRHGKLDCAMLARCIIQSQTGVYKAMIVFIYQESHVDQWLLDEKEACENSIEALSKMEAFVNDARDGGVVSISEAECLKHTVHQYIGMLMDRVEDVCEGRAQEPVYAQLTPMPLPTPDDSDSDHLRPHGSLFGPCEQELPSNSVGQKPAQLGPGPKVWGASDPVTPQAEPGRKSVGKKLPSDSAPLVKQGHSNYSQKIPTPRTLGVPSTPPARE